MNQTPHIPRLKWTRDLQNLLLGLSLVLTLLVFWGPPLLSSLERPSVQGVLEQRQLELQALAGQAGSRGISPLPRIGTLLSSAASCLALTPSGNWRPCSSSVRTTQPPRTVTWGCAKCWCFWP